MKEGMRKRGGSVGGMDELMDYEWLVPNVSGVFAALTSEGGTC